MVTSGSLALTSNQADKLISVIDRLGDEVLIRLALNTGLRREDIVGLKRANINFKENFILFYEKKKKITRSLYVSPDIIILITKYFNASPKSEWLFPSANPKKHICGKTAYNTLQRCLEKAGLPRRPFHALRATFVKLAQKNGWSIEQVMSITGDAFQTIKLHYDTPSTEEMREVAENKPIL